LQFIQVKLPETNQFMLTVLLSNVCIHFRFLRCLIDQYCQKVILTIPTKYHPCQKGIAQLSGNIFTLASGHWPSSPRITLALKVIHTLYFNACQKERNEGRLVVR